MILRWTNTASLLLSEDDTVIAFDPFLGMFPDQPESEREELLKLYREAKNVFVTHGHFDHIASFAEIYKDTNTKIYATATPVASLKRDGLDEKNLVTIRPGQAFRIGPFRIDVYHSKHCNFDTGIVLKTVFNRRMVKMFPQMRKISALRKAYPENGEIVFYDIRCKDKHLQILGSMNYDETVSCPKDADLLILPLQGRSDQDTYALRIVDRFRPKRILLDHYDDSFPPMTSPLSTEGFEKNVRQKGIGCDKMKQYENYSI